MFLYVKCALINVMIDLVKIHEATSVIKSKDRLLNKEGSIVSCAFYFASLIESMHVTVFSLRDAVSVRTIFELRAVCSRALAPCLLGNFSYNSIERVCQRRRRP
jgi:hypothetical protein